MPEKSRYDPAIHHRRSIRLSGYDYSQAGAYFLTLCTHDRMNLFGRIVNGEMRLNDYGRIIRDEWLKSANIRGEIELDEFIVMPNHVHGIVIIHDINMYDCRGDRPVAPTPVAPTTPGPKPKSIASFAAGFKSAATKRINEIRHTPGIPVWQRNYYEHIIRDDNVLDRIREYIIHNPATGRHDNLIKNH